MQKILGSRYTLHNLTSRWQTAFQTVKLLYPKQEILASKKTCDTWKEGLCRLFIFIFYFWLAAEARSCLLASSPRCTIFGPGCTLEKRLLLLYINQEYKRFCDLSIFDNNINENYCLQILIYYIFLFHFTRPQALKFSSHSDYFGMPLWQLNPIDSSR